MVRCSVFGVIMFMLFSAGVTGQYGNCPGDLDAINDGKCDTGNNNVDCGFDGGDCCECSCIEDRLFPCGIWGYDCLDPDTVDGSGDCRNETSSVGPCPTDSLQTWFVDDTASASSLTEALNCSGGTFDVTWRGSVLIEHTIMVLEGTTVYLTGEGSGAEVNGGGKTRLFKARGATLQIDNMILRGGNASYGGAVDAARSDVFLNQTSCRGNIASTYGGAFYVGRRSTLMWGGQKTLADNHAGRGGGVAIVCMNSNVMWGGSTEFRFNTATGDYASGGAMYVMDQSRVSWEGATSFINNTSSSYGGAFFVEMNSTVSWDGVTSFTSNNADGEGGALYVNDKSSIAWDGNASFIDNTASLNISGGGALCIKGESTVSWHGVTCFSGNAAYYGGAFLVNNSTASWDGVTSFINNAGLKGGAGVAYNKSTISWGGVTSFVSNTASVNGGALSIELVSDILWSAKTSFVDSPGNSVGGMYVQTGANTSSAAKTSFINNNAYYGGAISLESGSTASWIGETSFTRNKANSSGGAIYVALGSTITVGGDTNFRRNRGDIHGGAVYAYVGYDEAAPSYVIVDSDAVLLFHGNACGINGGAIALMGAVVTQFNSSTTFSKNSAGVAGGAVYMSGVSLGLRFVGAMFFSNSAVIGGAVYTTGSGTAVTEYEYEERQQNPTTFIGCDFIGNKAQRGGGALDSGAGIDLIVNTSFTRNTAAIGGALRLNGVVSLDGCEFIENSSDEDEGPGISNDGEISSISSCAFVENVFNCQPGFYLEYNETDAQFDSVCKGCDTHCNGCIFEGKEPIMCLEELEHSIAAGGSVTLDLLLIESGYWRATNTSTNILACYNTKACLGGVTGEEGYCDRGYEGPYCSVCSEGYTANLGFSCTKCSENIAGSIALAILGTIVIFLVFVAFLSYILSWASEDAHRSIVARLTWFIPLQSVKIVIVVWQILTQFSAVTNVVFPSIYQNFLDGVDVLNFDLTWMLSAGCFIDADFHDQLLFATLGPLVGMAILGITYVAAMRRSRASEVARRIVRRKHVSMVLLLTFLVYSPVSSTLFKTFACDYLDDGKNYLREDYQIDCSSSKHSALEIYAGIMVVLYVVGIPVFYVSLLYGSRKALAKHTGREEDASIKPIRDLWKPYRPDRFYYEVIECMRRVLLTGVLVFIYPNTAAQIAVALMMATFFIFVSESLAPYVSPWDAWCCRTGHAIVFTTIFLALLLKVDVSGERTSWQRVFVAVLVAAQLFLILIVLVEAIAIIVAWRRRVDQCTAPRIRPSVSV